MIEILDLPLTALTLTVAIMLCIACIASAARLVWRSVHRKRLEDRHLIARIEP